MKFLKTNLDWCCAAVVIIASLTLVESDRPHFREDYRYEKGFRAFYKVHHIAADWWEARIRCEGEGAELIVPDNLDEADALPLLISAIHTRFKGIFVGIHDLYSERTFVTIKGYGIHDSILNLLWEYAQPVPKAGHCLAMHHNGRLFVQPCEDRLPFICKVKAESIEYHTDCDTFDPRWTLGPNDTCYLHHVEPQTWFDAFSTCLATGGHLAVMNSRAEAEFTRGMLQKVPERRLPENDFVFIGFNDLFQKHHYRSIHGHSLVKSGYTDWALSCGQKPNSTGEQRCGGLRRSGLLAVRDCHMPAMFICEKKIPGPPSAATHEDDSSKKGLRMVSFDDQVLENTSSRFTVLTNTSKLITPESTSAILFLTKGNRNPKETASGPLLGHSPVYRDDISEPKKSLSSIVSLTIPEGTKIIPSAAQDVSETASQRVSSSDESWSFHF